MATETLYPDAIITQTGFVGSVSAIQGAADGTWLTSDGTDNQVLRVSMPTPTGPPNGGAGLQTLRIYVKKNATGGGDPTMDVVVYDNGTLYQTLATAVTVTTATGVQYTYTWNAATLSNADGSTVQFEIDGFKGGGGPNERNLQVDSIAWDVDYTVFTPTYDGTGSSTATASESGLAEASVGPSASSTATASESSNPIGENVAWPDSDVEVGGWTTPPLFSKVSTGVAPDDTVIKAGNVGTYCELSLTGLPAPSGGVRLTIRARSATSSNLVVSLVEGTTVRATRTLSSLTASFADYEVNLTEPEVSSVVDWTNVRVRLDSVAP